jgi:hypothetical protein
MRAKLRWLFRRRLCFGGLAGALVFFCLSLTPSLLPRGDILQGVLSGVSAVIGYGFGSLASATIRTINPVEPQDGATVWDWLAILVIAIVFAALLLCGSWPGTGTDTARTPSTRGPRSTRPTGGRPRRPNGCARSSVTTDKRQLTRSAAT